MKHEQDIRPLVPPKPEELEGWQERARALLEGNFEKPGQNSGQPFDFKNPNIILRDYVQVPDTKKVISKFELLNYNNSNWQDAHFKLHDNKLQMPEVPLFIQHFLNVVDAYKNKGKKQLFDANGNSVSEKEIKDIFMHLTKNHIDIYNSGNPGAWAHLDAKFEQRSDGMYVLSEHRTFKDTKGNNLLQSKKAEKLEACVANDSFTDLKFNKQGFPIKQSAKQEYRQGENIKFWAPVDGGVARFGAVSVRAYLDCNWYPSFTNSSLGVRSCKAGLAGGIK